MIKQTGIMRRYHSFFAFMQRLLDCIGVFCLMPLLCLIRGIPYSQLYQITAIIGALLTWAIMEMAGAYRPWRGVRLWQEVQVIFNAWIVVACGMLLIGWSIRFTTVYSRIVIGSWFVLSPILIVLLHVAERFLLRLLRRHGKNNRTAIIIGAGKLGKEFAERISKASWMGINIVGFFDDDPAKAGQKIYGIPVLGTGEQVEEYVKQNAVNNVYFTLPMRAEKRMLVLFDKLQDTTCSLFLVPDLFVFELLGSREYLLAGMPVFSLCESPFTGPFGLLKRMEDIVVATVVLLLTWPLLLFIAIGIKLSSPGPVIFKQRRYGLNGRVVKVYKFRTMTVCEDGDDVQQAKRSDPRVTRFGAFLRRTSLDEMPQFFNVLQGRMSVVGPRPHAVAHNELYRNLIKGYMWRNKVRPGISGLAQINGWRGETDTLEKMQKRVEYDLEYIRNWSIWLDIKIIFLTLLKGITDKNAY